MSEPRHADFGSAFAAMVAAHAHAVSPVMRGKCSACLKSVPPLTLPNGPDKFIVIETYICKECAK